jgi:hypothetical protein
MSAVLRLFWQEAGRTPPEPRSDMAAAVDAVLTSSIRLSQAAARLVERLDAIDQLICALEDPEGRRAYKELMESQREWLSISILTLKAGINRLPQSRVSGFLKIEHD